MLVVSMPGVKSRYLGGSGRSSAARMVFWLAVRLERWATRPSSVARVDQVHAVEFLAQVAPGVAGGGFGGADQQQCQPI